MSKTLAGPSADCAEIRKALGLLAAPGGVVEIRALKIPGKGRRYNAAGYFSDLDKAAETAAAMDARQAGGVYVVLNEVNPALLARSANRAKDHLEPLTGDGDITRRRWLPLDFDPTRPAEISATEDEHCEAEYAAQKCEAWLSSLGWPVPILADSGNGAHLLYRIDLSNDETNTALVRDVIAAISNKWDRPHVKIDRKVFNAGRIFKVYGTTARKGDDMPDRPHRVAKLIEVPESVDVVPVALLQALAATIPKPEPKPSTNGNGHGQSFNHRLDVPRWLNDRGQGFKVKDRSTSDGRTVYILDACPFDPSHGGNGEVSVMQEQNGKLSAACMHNSCTGKDWQHFKEAIGNPDGNHYDPPWSDHQGNGQPRQSPAVPTTKPAASDGKPQEPLSFTKLLTGGELLAMEARPSFLVKGVLVEGQPMIVGGRSKTLKTSIVCDLVVSLGSGTPFLGRFDTRKVPVGFWSGESGAATIRDTARRCAEARHVHLSDALTHWSFDLPQLSNINHLVALKETILAHGLKVAIFDPLYLALLSSETASGASNLFLMGSLLQGLTRLGQETGCTIVILHHFRKGGLADDENPAGLEELAQSGGAEWARQWILLQRRCPYQSDGNHSLWMRCGGSAGHSSLWGVNIDDGTIDPETGDGRRWDVTVSPAADARQEAARDRESRKAAEVEQREGGHRARLLTVLKTLPNGETERALSRAAGLNRDNFGKAIFALIQEGRATTCQIVKNGVTYDGFKTTGK